MTQNQSNDISKPQRAVVFIDGAYYSFMRAELLHNARVDLQGFLRRVCAPGEFLHAHYFDCVSAMNRPFVDAISHMKNCTVRLGDLTQRQNGSLQQKGVDVLLAISVVDAVMRNSMQPEEQRFDTIVLVAADGDFVHVVEYARQHGIRVLLAHGPVEGYERIRVSARLLCVCDQSVRLDADWFDGLVMHPQRAAA